MSKKGLIGVAVLGGTALLASIYKIVKGNDGESVAVELDDNAEDDVEAIEAEEVTE